MKRILLVAALVFFATSAYGVEKIGFVDLQKALNESDAGIKAKTKLEAVVKEKQAAVDEKSKEIEKFKTELEQQSSALSPEAKKAKQDELEKMMRDYQRLVKDSQDEIRKEESELTSTIISELRGITEKIGQEDGYTIIFEAGDTSILYHQKGLDITDKVLKRFNETHKQKK